MRFSFIHIFGFIIFLLFSSFDLIAQQIECDFVSPICSSESIDASSPTSNPGETIITECQILQSNNTHWYYVRIQSGTTFTFTISPDSPLDYDFAVWLNPEDCNNLGEADRGSFAAGGGATGLSCNFTDLCEGAGGNRWLRYLDVQPGDLVVIAVDRYDDNAVPYNLSFGDCGGSGDDTELDCTILGDSYGKCDVDGDQQESFVASEFLPDLNEDFPGSQFEFYYTKPNAENGSGAQVSFPHPVNSAGNPNLIFARVENASGIFLRAVQINLYVNQLPQLTAPVNLPPLCDFGDDGEEEFDLTLAEPDLVTDPALYLFKYYEDEDDAIAGASNFINPSTAYDSGAATIYVRVETGSIDGNEDGCFSVGEINLSLTQAEQPLFSLENEYCTGEIPNLDTNSVNGINGTWNPPSIDISNYETQTYVFTPNVGECAVPFEIDIRILENIVPEFTIGNTYCVGETAPPLPLVSENDIEIAGTWNYPFIDTSVPITRTYIFTPDDLNCNSTFDIEIQITPGASLDNNLQIELCDENFDEAFEYNLTLINSQLISETTGLTFHYYATQQDYTNDNPIPENQWENYPLALPASVVVTAINTQACKSEPVDVQFIEGQSVPLLGGPYEIPFCDGESVDLSLFQNSFFTNEADVSYTYYPTNEDAENQTGEITEINNYPPSGIGSNIFVRIEKNDGTLCTDIVEAEFIEGQSVPLLGGPYEIPFCEGESVDLSLFQNNFFTNEADVSYTYYPTNEDAENQTGEITEINNYPPSGIGSSIFVRIEKDDGTLCPEIVPIDFVAGQEVAYNAGPYGPIEYCKDEMVDITTYASLIPNESGVDIDFYLSNSDAEGEVNPIPDETAFTPQGNGFVYIRLEKEDRCAVILELPYVQKASPSIIDLPSEIIICEGEETIDLSVSSDDPNATFEWTWGSNQSSTGSTITITETGTYKLTVIGSNLCRTEDEVIVRVGGQPTITSIESGDDYLIVVAQAGEGGLLEYSLDGVFWQASSRFEGLIKGQTYTVHVRERGCLIAKYVTAILNLPNFVSPNGDGLNDLWTIRGIEVTPNATIKIFDRNGKIFVDTNFDGNYIWDGKYGGRPVPSGDYWYIMEVPSDGVILGQKFVGHISIRN